MSQPHASPAGAAPPHDEAELAHFLSKWPVLVAMSMAFFLLGVVLAGAYPSWGPVVAFIGVILVFVTLAGWVREDMHHFEHPPHEELFHHGKAPNPFWGIILFLGTEVVLFGALFALFFHARGMAGSEFHQAGIELPLLATGINTAILVSSGATMHFAQHSIAHGNRRRFKLGLLLTLLLGATFLTLQVREYIHLIEEGLTLKSSFFGSIFYGLTGTHGLHVFGGLVAIFIVFVRALRGQFSPQRYLLVEGAAFYWHFVDVVWIFLYAVIYLQWL